MRPISTCKKCLCCGAVYGATESKTKCSCGGYLYIMNTVYQEKISKREKGDMENERSIC